MQPARDYKEKQYQDLNAIRAFYDRQCDAITIDINHLEKQQKQKLKDEEALQEAEEDKLKYFSKNCRTPAHVIAFVSGYIAVIFAFITLVFAVAFICEYAEGTYRSRLHVYDDTAWMAAFFGGITLVLGLAVLVLFKVSEIQLQTIQSFKDTMYSFIKTIVNCMSK